jgi:hypothetical protein
VVELAGQVDGIQLYRIQIDLIQIDMIQVGRSVLSLIDDGVFRRRLLAA